MLASMRFYSNMGRVCRQRGADLLLRSGGIGLRFSLGVAGGCFACSDEGSALTTTGILDPQ
jgi:hypothetical protein